MSVFLLMIIISIIILLIRILKGPTIWDRLLALNVILTNVVIVIICLAIIKNQSDLYDIAITYSILGFCATVLIARFIERRENL